MDELSEDDKLTVARARKIQRFLSQPFQVAEVFTGHPGKLVPLEETIKVSLDSIPEGAWLMFFVVLRDSKRSWAATTITCPKSLSTWSAPLKKSCKRPRNWPNLRKPSTIK